MIAAPSRIRHAWTAEQDEYLRASYGRMPTRDIAAELGRSENAVGQHAGILGLSVSPFWTEERKAIVLDLYETHTCAQIAERLFGDSRKAMHVHRMAARMGLRKFEKVAAEFMDKVRSLHAAGLNDREIATELGSTRDKVHHVRWARLKLPANEASLLAARRRGVQTQFRALGIRTGGELRALAHKRYAVENGWPEDVRPREVQILNVLAAAGRPMTKMQISQAIGMRTDRIGCNNSPALLTGNGHGGTYTSALLRRGLVVVLKRGFTVSGKGRGKSLDLYALSDLAYKILEQRCTAPTTP